MSGNLDRALTDVGTSLGDSDIGVSVQEYDANTVVDSDYYTDKTRLANTSGTNTGDQTLPTNSDFTITGLSDTNIVAPADTQALTYDSASGKWINTDTSSGGGGIGEFIDTSIAISSDGSALANDDGSNNTNIAIGKNCLKNTTTLYGSIAIGNACLEYANAYDNIGIGVEAGRFISSGQKNVAIGYNSLKSNFDYLTGSYNTGIGYQTGYNLTTGQYNVLNGYQAGYSLTTAQHNIAIGEQANYSNSTNGYNVAVGRRALRSNTSYQNVGVGNASGYNITSGAFNTALGDSALQGNYTSNLTGSYNIGIGYQSGYSLSTGQYNVLNGYKAGYNLTSGSSNIYLGEEAGFSNTSTSRLISIGYKAGFSMTGATNIAIGERAGFNASGANNICIGYYAGYATTTGANNTYIGRGAGWNGTGADNTTLGYSAGSNLSTGSNNLILGKSSQPSVGTVSNEITLGNDSITRFRIPGLGIDWTEAPSGGGAMELIQTVDVTSSVSSVDFTGLSGYNRYEILVNNVRLSANSTLYVLLGLDGAFQTSGYIPVSSGLAIGTSGGYYLSNVSISGLNTTTPTLFYSTGEQASLTVDSDIEKDEGSAHTLSVAYNSLRVYSLSATLEAGSISIYGIKD